MIRYYKKKIFSLKHALNAMPDNLYFDGNDLSDSINIYKYQIGVLNSIKDVEKKISKEKNFVNESRKMLRTKAFAKQESKKIKSDIEYSIVSG